MPGATTRRLCRCERKQRPAWGDGITWPARYKIGVVIPAEAGIQAGVPAWAAWIWVVVPAGVWLRVVIPAEAGIQAGVPAWAAW
ncbi:MAG: hypothetical protein OXR07_02410, partial [Nitrospira sp.]|nr:hypothetical protein [Nitrospira sp.]